MHGSLSYVWLACFCCTLLTGAAQSSWTILDSPGRLIVADASQTDEEGWTHYYRSEDHQLILSIQQGGQPIGDLRKRLRITTGLLSNYGQGAHDLSGAEYVDQGIWLTMNRYWRIEQAEPLFQPVRVRFYFDPKDVEDLQRGLAGTPQRLLRPDEIRFYTLEGGSPHPFTFRVGNHLTQLVYHDPRSGRTGTFDGILYAELEVSNLNCSGSGGFFVPLEGTHFSVSGKIETPAGIPLENIFLQSPTAGAAVRTSREGLFRLANLPGGITLPIEPYAPGGASERVTVLDLLGVSDMLSGKAPLKSPYQRLAGDVNRSGNIDSLDLTILREVVLGLRADFPHTPSWQFIPADAPLPDKPAGPFILEHLSQDVDSLHFFGIKTGNVWEESDFPNEPPSIVDPHFYFEEYTSCGGGEPIPFELKVRDFQDIHGFQFTITWDPEALAFVDVRDMDLPLLGPHSFGRAEVEAGRLTIAWHAPFPARMRDDSTICTLLMRARGGKDSNSSLGFDGAPTPIQVIRKNRSSGNAFFTPGQIHVDNRSPIQLVKMHARQASCFGGADGSIQIRLKGGTGPFFYQWSNGAHTRDIRGLKAGTYAVTIHDGNACPFYSPPIEVAQPAPISIEEVFLHPIRCPGVADGAISFTPQGGDPPYTFQWNTGAATPWLGKLPAGDYAVTVTDSKGCQAEKTFALPEPENALLQYSITAPRPGTNGGKIQVHELWRSKGPHEFAWSTGARTPAVSQLRSGAYRLTVNDAEGCTYQYAFELKDQPPPAAFTVHLTETAALAPATPTLLLLHSPTDQTVELKVFDQRSKLLAQKNLPLLQGYNQYYFTSPAEAGAYLLQVLSGKDGVRSERLQVRNSR